MTTATDEYLARYRQVEKEADSLGRIIAVGRLRISQQIKISEMTPGLEGDTELPGGATIARRSLPLVAAAVRKIDDNHIPFPRNRGELDAIMDQLDEPGLMAALKALTRLSPPQEEKSEDEQAGDFFDQAKK